MAPLNEQMNPRWLAEQAQQLQTYFNAFAADGVTWDLLGDLPEIQQNEHDLAQLKQSIVAQWRLVWVREGIKAALRLLPAAHAVAATEAIIHSLKGESLPARLKPDTAVAQAAEQASKDQLAQTLTTLVAADTENTNKLSAAFLKEYERLTRSDRPWLNLLRRLAAPIGISVLALLAVTIAATAGWRFFGDGQAEGRFVPSAIAENSTPTQEQLVAEETPVSATETMSATETIAAEPSVTGNKQPTPSSPSATTQTTTSLPSAPASPSAAAVEGTLTPLEVIFVEAEQKYEPSQFTLSLNQPLTQRVTLRDTSATIKLSLVQPAPASSTAVAPGSGPAAGPEQSSAASAPPIPSSTPAAPATPAVASALPIPSPVPAAPAPNASASPDPGVSPAPEVVVTLALNQPPPLSGPAELTLYLDEQQTAMKVKGVVRRIVKGVTAKHSDQTAADYYKDKLANDKWAAHIWKTPAAPDTTPTVKLPDKGQLFTLLVDGDIVDILEEHGDYYVVRIVDNFDKVNDPDVIGRTGWIKKIYING